MGGLIEPTHCLKCGRELDTGGKCTVCTFEDLIKPFKPFTPLPDPGIPVVPNYPWGPVTFPDYPDPNPVIPFPGSPAPPGGPIGWICPRCGRGNSPYNNTCSCYSGTCTTTDVTFLKKGPDEQVS